MAMSDKDRKITKAVVEAYDKSKKKVMDLLDFKDLELTGQFAKALHRSIKDRYTLAQLTDILFVSFFDPMWQSDLPKWAISRRMSNKE